MKKQSSTEKAISLRIILVAPPMGVDFGIQEGKGSNFKTIQMQRSKDSDLQFECNVGVKGSKDDGPPNFVGNIVQGPPLGRFIYIDIGKAAGQFNSNWERRIKIPLLGITWEMVAMISRSICRSFKLILLGLHDDFVVASFRIDLE